MVFSIKTKGSFRILLAGGVFFALFLQCDNSFPWNDKVTHKGLSIISAERSENLKGFLTVFDFSGLDDEIEGKTIKEYFQEGNIQEDAATDRDGLRAVNHFHNPLKDWSEAGLNDIFAGQSSLLWAQDSGNLLWSWEISRLYFFNSLTAENDHQYLWNLGRTFQALGHQTHLVQDLAQPAHVRNDSHIFDAKHIVEEMETWAAKNHINRVLGFASNPIPPGFTPSQTVNDLAPITEFWDRNQYLGTLETLPGIGSTSSGLAEYTNANFFSDDTISSFFPKHQFPFPSNDSSDYFVCDGEAPLLSLVAKRIYLSRAPCSAGQDEYVLTKSVLSGPPPFFGAFPLRNSLDSRIYESYAKKLIPRAVGYSTAMIDYFFRGRLGVKGGAFTNSSRDTVRFKVANLTPDEAATGAVTVAARYKLPGDDTIYSQVSGPVGVGTLSTTLEGAGFNDYALSGPVPEDAEGLEFVVAFKGTLGAEIDTAVIGQVHKPETDLIFIIQEETQLLGGFGSNNLDCVKGEDGCRGDISFDIYARERTDVGFGRVPQVFSGRFEGPGKIKAISHANYDGTPAGTLYINGTEMPSRGWRPGYTPDPPQTWKLESNNISNFSTLIHVTVEDKEAGTEGIFTAQVAHLTGAEARADRHYWCFSDRVGDCRGYWAETARITMNSGYFETPELKIPAREMYKLGNLGGASSSSSTPIEVVEEWWDERAGTFQITEYKSISVRLDSYVFTHWKICRPCGSYSDDTKTVYDGQFATPKPEIPELNLSGEYTRVYGEEELGYWNERGITPPDPYKLILSGPNTP